MVKFVACGNQQEAFSLNWNAAPNQARLQLFVLAYNLGNFYGGWRYRGA